MLDQETIKNRLLSLTLGDDINFLEIAETLYQYQSQCCNVYKSWMANSYCKEPDSFDLISVPKLHISAWKQEKVLCKGHKEETIYTSSGTSGQLVSQHFVEDVEFYLQNCISAFEASLGPLVDYCILGLLPSYMERSGSSLVGMVEKFVKVSKYEESGMYLDNHKELSALLNGCKERKVTTLLIGVSFGLLDYLENHQHDFEDLIVMETGGMKGRRTEMSKIKLHDRLKSGFGVEKVYSEYGMTELMSQAYSRGGGLFRPSATMRVFITEINDPKSQSAYGKSGIINIVDLANINTCAFLCTDDIGIGYEDGTFEVIGRLDHSDIRGCNLMVGDL